MRFVSLRGTTKPQQEGDNQGNLGEFNKATIYKGEGETKEYKEGMMRPPQISNRGSHYPRE